MQWKLKHKIIVLFLMSGSVILILIGGVLSANLRETIIQTITHNYSLQLSHVDFGLTKLFQNIENDLELISQNELVRSRDDSTFTNFTEAREESFTYHYTDLELKIIAIFNGYRLTHPYVYSVYMGRENGSFIRSHKRARPTRYDPRTRPWYVLGVEDPGRIRRTPPFPSLTTADVSIDFVKALVDEDGVPYGVVGIGVTLSDLTDYLSKIDLDYSGELFLLDKTGTIVASHDKSLLFQSLSNYHAGLYEKIDKDDETFYTFQKGANKRYAFFYTSPALGWKLGISVSKDEIDGEIRMFVLKILSVLFLALVALSLLTLFGLQKLVVKPLKMLSETTQVIARTGNLDHHIPITSRDEIGGLATSFNTMTRDLKTYMEELAATTAAREKIESELTIAHDIQMGILPKEAPSFAKQYKIDIHAVLEPAKQVGGDLYDFFLLDKDRFCFVIGDVCGKGVPAALFMSAAKTLIKATAKTVDDPAVIMSKVNQEISSGNESGTFITVFLGVIELETGEMHYINAGHNPPFILRENGETELLTGARNMALGIDETFNYRFDTITLKLGELIFLYTDGVTEAFDSTGDMYSAERLQQEIAACNFDLSRELVSHILKNVTSFSRDVPQTDDITIMAIRFGPGLSRFA